MRSTSGVVPFLIAASTVGCAAPDAAGTRSEGVTPSAVSASAPASTSGPAAASAAPSPTCSVRTKPLKYVAWSPSGALLLTGGPTDVAGDEEGKPVSDGSFDAWNLATGAHASTFHLGAPIDAYRTDNFAYVAFAPDGKSALASGTSHTGPSLPVARWDFESGATTFAAGTIYYPEGIDISHDGKLAIVDGGGNNALVLELPSLKVVKSILNDTAASGSMRFSQDDEAIVSDWQMSMSLDDPRTLKSKKEWPGAVGTVSPDRRTVALFAKGFWGIVDATSGKPLKTFERPAEVDAMWGSVVYAPDSKHVALLRSETVSVWNVETGTKSGEVKAEGPCRWTADGTILICEDEPFVAGSMKPLAKLPAGRTEIAAGHTMLLIDKAKATVLDVEGGRSWGRTFDLIDVTDATNFVMSTDRAFLAYARPDTGTMHIVRLVDGASIDLGVAWIDKTQRGFAVSSDGTFEGPEAARCQATKALGRDAKRADGVVRRFFAR